MSRWFPDSLKVRVCAEALEFELIAPKETRAWSRALVADEGGTSGTQALCSALDAELLALSAVHLKIEVILQSSWMRYCLIPWNADFTSLSDRASFVQHCFFDMYGELARRWTVQSTEPAYGKSALGAAIDSELLSGLSKSAKTSGRKLIGVRPELTERIDLARPSIKSETFWFVLADAHNYTLLLMHAGSPAVVLVAGRREAHLETLLERAWRSSGLEQERCRVYADFGPSSAIELGDSRLGWLIERLPTVSPARAVGPIRTFNQMAG